MDIPRFLNITESAHRIHNPFTPDKFATLGVALRLSAGARVLDLGSGLGEMLCTWARDHGIVGTGIDKSPRFTAQAKQRAQDVAKKCLAGATADCLVLPELLASFAELGCDAVEMVLANWVGMCLR